MLSRLFNLYFFAAPAKPVVLSKAISPSEIEVTIKSRYYDSAVVEINGNDGENLTVTFNSTHTSTVFSALTPETTYRITVTLTIGGKYPGEKHLDHYLTDLQQ